MTVSVDQSKTFTERKNFSCGLIKIFSIGP